MKKLQQKGPTFLLTPIRLLRNPNHGELAIYSDKFSNFVA